jgi:hypothetical protein
MERNGTMGGEHGGADVAIAFFDGAAELVRLITELTGRPRDRDVPLPLLWLKRSGAQAGVISGLHARIMAATPRRVPNARVDVAQYPLQYPLRGDRDVQALLALLVELCGQLGLDKHGFPRITFRHFRLVAWLMKQDHDANVVDERAWLVQELRKWMSPSLLDLVAAAGQQAAPPGLTALLAGLLRLLVPAALFHARVSGRIPGIGREFRWCMRQRYLVPRLSASFAGFGVRLTWPHRKGEEVDQVARLMVHAFLQDLRVAYARRPWWPADWRRTAYPVALLNNVRSDNGGWALLQLVNDVRNESGQFDPLLIVSAGEQLPAGIPATSVSFAGDALSGHRTWEHKLREARHRLHRFGWYLPIELPEPSGRSLDLPPITPAPPPWWARRMLPVGLVAVLLLTTEGMGLVQEQRHCGAAWEPGATIDIQLAQDGECIGYSDSARYVFGSQATGGEADLMIRLQSEIFSLNAEAESLHEAPGNAGLPVLTLIYLSQLTIPVTNTAIVADEREELEGIAIRQRMLLEGERSQAAPLLKVILANAGGNMRYAGLVADMLRPLVARDPTIVGVLGFNESRDETVQAITKLDRMGLPMVAPNLSADGLEQSSQLYFQIAAPNRQEAELMAGYVASTGVRRVNIVYTESAGDLYTRTLRADLAGDRAHLSGPGVLGGPGILAEHGIEIDNIVGWTPRTDPSPLVCAYSGVVLYTGRAEDFDTFMRTVARTCGATRPAPIIGDDSVGRFMASAQERRDSQSNYPLLYVSKAGFTSCAPSTNATWEAFRKKISGDPWYACDAKGRGLGPMGERVALAYDGTDAFVSAAKSLGDIPLSRGAIWEGLRAQKFDGISGLVDFSHPVQQDHWIALMQVNHMDDLPDDPNDPAKVVFHCGWASSAAVTAGSPACTA